MKNHKFSIVSHIHNDAEYIPYYIKHWIDRVDMAYIIDDGPSTDSCMDIVRREAPHWIIIERESDQWDAVAVDLLCRQIERMIDGWVVLVTCDEFIYATREQLEEYFSQADALGLDIIKTNGFQVIQHPTEEFIVEKPFEEQFYWGVPEPMISRTLHRNQNDKSWEYTVGRHLFPEYILDENRNIVSSNFPYLTPPDLLLGDHKYAPKEMSFRHMLVDGARVGPLDQSRGYGINKVGRTWEKLEAEYQEVLSRAVKFR